MEYVFVHAVVDIKLNDELFFSQRISVVGDIRNASNKEQEVKRITKEMSHIRAKYKEGNLDGYDKKKYDMEWK